MWLFGGGVSLDPLHCRSPKPEMRSGMLVNVTGWKSILSGPPLHPERSGRRLLCIVWVSSSVQTAVVVGCYAPSVYLMIRDGWQSTVNHPRKQPITGLIKQCYEVTYFVSNLVQLVKISKAYGTLFHFRAWIEITRYWKYSRTNVYKILLHKFE